MANGPQKLYVLADGVEPIPISVIDEEHYKLKSECLSYGFMRVHKKSFFPEKTKMSNAYPEFWMAFFADLPEGYVLRINHKRKIFLLSGKCALYMPRMAIVEWEIPAGWLEWTGYTSIHPVTDSFPNEAVAFRIPEIPLFSKHSDMIAFMERHIPDAMRHQEEDRPESVHKRVFDHINHNFEKDMTIDDISVALGIPVSTIAHEFKRVYGIPPHKYIHILRVFQALDYVSTGEEITKVMSKVGYKNYSSLYRHCMAVTGKPPSIYGRRGFAPQVGGIDIKSIDRLA